MEFLNPDFLTLCINQKQVSNLANNYDIACFSSKNDYHSNLYVVSQSYDIKYKCSTDCYIHCCGISDSGRYLIFQTANAPNNCRTDGNKHFFVDVINKKQLWSIPTETRFQTIKNYFIDERKCIITENHSDYQVLYDFQGNFINRSEWINWLGNHPGHSDASFYNLLFLACNLMQEAMENGKEIIYEKTIVKLIDSSIEAGIRSEYQLGNTYKLLGDFYFNISEGEKALSAYKKGLQFCPKLPVKRTIKKLENSLGIETYTTPKNHHDIPLTIHPNNYQREYLYTKWGTYEMPEPYTIKFSYGPRKDAKEIHL